jgi:outer membrane protein assembly factor BamB
MRRSHCCVAIVFGWLLTSRAPAGEWPQFRGPSGAGIADGAKLPDVWSGESNVQWKVAVPGVAWSSPIVWGDKIFVTTAVTANQRKPRSDGGGGGRPGGFGGGRPPFGGGGRPGGQPGENPNPPGGAQGDEKPAAPDAQRPGNNNPGGAEPPRNPGGRPGGGFGGRPGGGFGRSQSPPDVTYQWEVLCLDRVTGKTLWKQTALEAKPRIPTHGSNTYATETPVTDGERVYAYFGMHGLFCYDMAGKLLWQKDLGSYPMVMGWGTSSSPALDDDRVFVQCDNEEKSFLVAFDKRTGDERWRVERKDRSSWSTPLVWRNKVRTEVVTLGSPMLRSYDPATGKQLWELNLGGGQPSSSPVADAEMLYAGLGGRGTPGGGRPGGARPGATEEEPAGGGRGGAGGGGALYAIRAGAAGDISLKNGEKSNAGVAWMAARAAPEMSSPLAYQGYVYIFSRNGGISICLDAKTGKEMYKQRIPSAKSFWASPWANDGRIYCLDDGGTTHVLAAGPEFKLLGANILGEMAWASPAAADDAVFLRSVDHLYCIRAKGPESK